MPLVVHASENGKSLTAVTSVRPLSDFVRLVVDRALGDDESAALLREGEKGADGSTINTGQSGIR